MPEQVELKECLAAQQAVNASITQSHLRVSRTSQQLDVTMRGADRMSQDLSDLNMRIAAELHGREVLYRHTWLVGVRNIFVFSLKLYNTFTLEQASVCASFLGHHQQPAGHGAKPRRARCIS